MSENVAGPVAGTRSKALSDKTGRHKSASATSSKNVPKKGKKQALVSTFLLSSKQEEVEAKEYCSDTEVYNTDRQKNRSLSGLSGLSGLSLQISYYPSHQSS